MEIVEGDTHDALAATYQGVELARLNESLKECGVADRRLRRRICEAYFFDSGRFLDGGWFAEDGRRYRPGLYFEEVDAAGRPTGTAHLPDPAGGTALHEYAHGAAIWHFDDNAESATAVEVGELAGPA